MSSAPVAANGTETSRISGWARLLHTPPTVQQLRCLTVLVLEGSAAPARLSALLGSRRRR